MLSLFSPAKLNLFLRVIGKRDDGYHELVSLFQAISLGDTLHFSLAQKDSFQITGPVSLPMGNSNLVIKALNLFRSKIKKDFSVSITLDKKVPIQAGLGGGSSNAATTLWALNELLDFPVSTHDLMEWSKELGSDVTFFLSGGTAFCTGRGEVIYPLPPLAEVPFCTVVKPNFGLPTPDVFKAFNINDRKIHNSYYYNDLESAAFLLRPALAQIKEDLLNAGFTSVVMSGSGTSFFCFGEGVIPSSLQSFPVHFVHRNPATWYPSPSIQMRS